MTKIWALLRQSGSDRLEKQPTDLRQNTLYFGDRTLANVCFLGTIVEGVRATVVLADTAFEDFFSWFICIDLNAITWSNMRLREHLEFNQPV
jgi:hypothetical protein